MFGEADGGWVDFTEVGLTQFCESLIRVPNSHLFAVTMPQYSMCS